jgi:hypothetical protein
LTWSAVIQQVATRLDKAVGNVDLSMTSSLRVPSWLAETGPTPDSDPVFSQVVLSPKRLSAKSGSAKSAFDPA